MIGLFGSTGFVGSHLAKYTNADILPVQIRNLGWENSVIKNVDTFINCIGKAHDHNNILKEEDYNYANYKIVKDIFSVFLESDATLLIHFSSIAVVEENSREVIITEDSECSPISTYGISKKKAEDFLLLKKLPKNKKIIIIRPSMIHGEGDKGNLNLLYKIISKGLPYPLGCYDNKRSFISIGNVVYFINNILQRKNQIKGGIYNMADDEFISTKKIIQIIEIHTGKRTKILYIPKPIVKIISRIGDIFLLPINSKRLNKMTSSLLISNTKLKKELGIDKLLLTAEEGLSETIKSFKK